MLRKTNSCSFSGDVFRRVWQVFIGAINTLKDWNSLILWEIYDLIKRCLGVFMKKATERKFMKSDTGGTYGIF